MYVIMWTRDNPHNYVRFGHVPGKTWGPLRCSKHFLYEKEAKEYIKTICFNGCWDESDMCVVKMHPLNLGIA